MCAITGFLSFRETNPADFVVNFIKLLQRSVERGRDGFGYAAFLRNTGTAVKKYIPPEEPGYFDHGLGDAVLSAKCFISNHRAEPTTEFVPIKTLEDQQPYTLHYPMLAPKDDLWCVHNGTIANDREIYEACGLSRSAHRIDSWAIPEAVRRFGLVPALERLQGSMAVALWAGELTLYRNYNPIYLWWSESRRTFVFSSFPDAVAEWDSDWRQLPFPPYTLIRGFQSDGTFSSETLVPANRTKAAVICSGGLDSVTAAMIAYNDCEEITLLHFAYGCQAQVREIDAVGKVASWLDRVERDRRFIQTGKPVSRVQAVVIDMHWLKVLGGSTLTTDGPIAQGHSGAEFAHEWVPARNTAMIGVAASYCDRHNIGRIYLGLNLEESGAYPDNTVEFFQAMGRALDVGTMARPAILNPLAHLMKKEIVKLALDLQAPIHLAWSCYKGEVQHCGTCGPCVMRRTAFRMLGVEDSVRYASA